MIITPAEMKADVVSFTCNLQTKRSLLAFHKGHDQSNEYVLAMHKQSWTLLKKQKSLCQGLRCQ